MVRYRVSESSGAGSPRLSLIKGSPRLSLIKGSPRLSLIKGG